MVYTRSGMVFVLGLVVVWFLETESPFYDPGWSPMHDLFASISHILGLHYRDVFNNTQFTQISSQIITLTIGESSESSESPRGQVEWERGTKPYLVQLVHAFLWEVCRAHCRHRM